MYSLERQGHILTCGTDRGDKERDRSTYQVIAWGSGGQWIVDSWWKGNVGLRERGERE